MYQKTSLILGLLLLTGCSVLPLRPGKAGFSSPSGISGHVQQSENPQSETTQIYEKIVEPCNQKTTERVSTKIGAAQKDVAREMAAKLSSLRGIVWLGAFVFLFGAASFVWLPLKAIVRSTTTSVVITIAGLALMFLPSLIVGNELLILLVCLGGAVAYWFAHRHGRLQGLVDANKDGIDDRLQ